VGLKSKDIGIAGEHLTMFDIVLQGYKCFKIEENLPFDLVMLDDDNKIYRIQVKSTIQRKRNYHTNNKISYCFAVTRQRRVMKKQIDSKSTVEHKENLYDKTDFDILALVAIKLKKVFYMKHEDLKLKYVSLDGTEDMPLNECL
tara:strand:- start:796 stop:1227 length:432 start_codon:yes stop_codon:yes gene_type:complete